MSKKNQILTTVPFLIFFAVFTFLVSENSFFWDTIQLGSKQAHWFYENNFRYLLLPDEIDSGHPPVFGMYLAVIWKIFGKTLAVSHWAMFPFLTGIVFQSRKLLKYFIDEKYLFPAMMLFIADTTLLAQCSLVSPDVVLVFFFLLSLNAILFDKKWLLLISLTGLSLISMRGMMGVLCVFFCHLYITLNSNNFLKIKKNLIRIIPLYISGSLISLAFLVWHFIQKGWIGYHPSSNWASSFEIVSFNEFIKNIFILGWRLIDFGRIFIWIFAFIFVVILWRKRKLSDQKTNLLLVFIFISLIVFTPTFLLYKNLSLHRYLLPVILMISLFTAYLLFQKIHVKNLKYFLFFMLLAGLISGNFWIYPDGIAEGWDSTLAHLPYYKLKTKMIQYIDKEKIPLTETGSAFPNLSLIKYTDLINDQRAFREKDLSKDKYIVQSNIFNDFSDVDLLKLKSEWILLKEFSKCHIYIRLYKKNKLIIKTK